MEKIYFDGYLWSIEDDPLCEDGSTPSYEDCRDCPCFMNVIRHTKFRNVLKQRRKKKRKNIKLKGYL